MLKKTVIFIVCALMVLNSTLVLASGGDMMIEDIFDAEAQETMNLDVDIPDIVNVTAIPSESLPAKSAVLMEQAGGGILYEKNADDPLAPASITKVMTMLLIVEAIDSGRISLEDTVITSEYASSMGGSQIWLEVGEEMTVHELLKAVAVVSANDASVALGEFIAGTNDGFVAMMNERAAELGMENTVFLNCTGLDEPGHLTTARDIAIMSRELMKHDIIKEYSTIWMDSLRGGESELVNTNRLVRFYPGATGLKTGTTNNAGSCLSATAEKNGLGLVAVILGARTSDERFSSAKALLDFGFANYTVAEVPSIDDRLAPVPVLRGVVYEVDITYEAPEKFVIEKANKQEIIQNIILVPDVEAPVAAGQVLGRVEILIGEDTIASYDLKAAGEVKKISVPSAFVKLLKGMLAVTAAPVKDSGPVLDMVEIPEEEAETTVSIQSLYKV